ncbi:MAG: CDP-diacylglycerol--serine O-phosphatidyltransferase [Bacteroidia bacterium]|nr:CDP-diacylglycerol--serine O-phosphatidyltransferase [Bacteroidia bacterium]
MIQEIKKHIPNLFTLGNLACGFIAIFFILKGYSVIWACWLVMLAGVLDFFDGFVARALKVSGELGKQLDSLADMVTFGVVPGFLAYYVGASDSWLMFAAAALIPLFSALRLAKFNIDERQHDTFIGVPTPMNTFFWVGLVFLTNQYPLFADVVSAPNVFYFLSIFSAFMLVAELPMLALKFKKLDKQFYIKLFVFVIPCIVGIIILGFAAFAPIYFYYLICSVLFKFAAK